MRLIDADALKEWIDEYVSVFKKSDIKDIKGYIEHQPTIEPKRGEWMPIIEANEFGEVYQAGIYCSECGETLGCEANFCPNCGADMRERKESE